MRISTEEQVPGYWIAVDDDTYDGAPDSHSIVGHGSTEQEAIDDLILETEEREERYPEEPCEHGHMGCAFREGGRCTDEYPINDEE